MSVMNMVNNDMGLTIVARETSDYDITYIRYQ